MPTEFLPATLDEMRVRGWDRPDVVLVTGDAYIDSPHAGASVIGRWLEKHGYKVGVISQPLTEDDVARLGEPRLFWGVTAGCVDSMVANFTAMKKRRHQDDFTPGLENNRRPDRASIVYTNLIRRKFKDTVPVVLGGLEASLRRVAHYDYWDDAVRRCLLFDAKADILVYGMGERSTLALARSLSEGREWRGIPGLCYIRKDRPEGDWTDLPAFEEVSTDKSAYWRMSELFLDSAGDPSARFLQRHGDRWLVHNPPPPPPSPKELDEVYDLPFARDAHPLDKSRGEVRALETIRQSITTHRGCYARCNFCAIAVHQGGKVVSRSEDSVTAEARRIAAVPGFNGIIYDLGGPTANMYGSGCARAVPCKDKGCLLPRPCPSVHPAHRRQLDLLARVLQVPGVTKVFVSSGLRYDLIDADPAGRDYVKALVARHVSGQIKVAPEHYDNDVLRLMGKPSIKSLMRFKAMFEEECRSQSKNYFMTYYLMAAHPGCTDAHMTLLDQFLKGGLRARPEQIQIFTPTPSTWSTAMYWCGRDREGRQIFVERNPRGKEHQKELILSAFNPNAASRPTRRDAKEFPAARRTPRPGPGRPAGTVPRNRGGPGAPRRKWRYP